MKFRLLAGMHIANDPADTRDLKPGERRREVTYQVGDVVESDTDLAARLGSQKFQPLYEGDLRDFAPKVQTPRNTNPADASVAQIAAPPQNPVETSEEDQHADDLDAKDEKKLRDIAVMEKIKVNGADTKEKLVEAIRKGRGPRV